MKICHVCNFECEENAELCPICGADLTQSEEKEVLEQAIVIEPVLLATLEDVVSAEIFMDILTENKIPYSCDQEGDGMKVVFGGGFASQDIYVDKANYDEAQTLYEEFLNSEPEFDGEFEFFEEEFEEE